MAYQKAQFKLEQTVWGRHENRICQGAIEDLVIGDGSEENQHQYAVRMPAPVYRAKKWWPESELYAEDPRITEDLRYDAESGIPLGFRPGNRVYLFDSETGALHDGTFVCYGKNPQGERNITIREYRSAKARTFEEGEIVSVLHQKDYPCN